MAEARGAAYWTITTLRAAYLAGETSPEAVVEDILKQAEQDAGMGIWIAPPDREAINPYVEGLSGLDPETAPLWGIPFAIKDNIDLAGVPTTAACPEFAYEPGEHAPVVARLIKAGAIPIGKTNLDQFATGLVGTRSPYGETHNALRPELISGGSSSGSAVAVARGQAVFALGTDTAGSGRVPAALNGLVGWKPSLGAWPTLGVVPACASLDCVTVFAHTLDDARLVDDVVRGPHAADPWSRSVRAELGGASGAAPNGGDSQHREARAELGGVVASDPREGDLQRREACVKLVGASGAAPNGGDSQHREARAELGSVVASDPHASDPGVPGARSEHDAVNATGLQDESGEDSCHSAGSVSVLLPAEEPEFYGPFAAEYRSAWLRAVEKLEKLSLPVRRVDTVLFAEAAAVLYEGPWVAERWASLGSFIDSHPGAAHPVTERILRTGASEAHDAASVFRAMHRLQRFKLEARELLQGSALLMPTCGGTWTREDVSRDPVGTNRDMGRFTNHCNLLDLCAVALPAGEAAPALPFGVTLFALADNENLLWELGARWMNESERQRGGQSQLTRTVSSAKAAQPIDTQGQAPYALEHGVAAISDRTSSAAEQAEAALAALSATNPDDSRPVGTSVPSPLAQPEEVPSPGMTFVAVCGLHMRGYPLERQMNECGAGFVRETVSAPKYRLLRLPTLPPKPGMVKRESGGSAIGLEVWEMPLEAFGKFAAGIPAPLGIGKVELSDGTEVPGFICEGYAAELEGTEDITATGGWRNASPLAALGAKER